MKTLIISLVMLSLLACQKKETANEPSESIEGSSWGSNCAPTGQLYDFRTANFTNGQFSMTSSAYADYRCSTGLLKMEAKGTYTIGSVISSTTNYVAIDEVLINMLVTPLNASVVSSYNTNSFCGFTNWALGVAKDVAGLVCNGEQVTASGTAGFDIYYASNGVLNFGLFDASHDGSSASTRPVDLDKTFNYTK